jgi:hypothetical protein
VHETIKNLLENACPSIQYRIQTEMLWQSSDDEEVRLLQGQILQDNTVREEMSWQGSDGWISSSFPGNNGIEAGI